MTGRTVATVVLVGGLAVGVGAFVLTMPSKCESARRRHIELLASGDRGRAGLVEYAASREGCAWVRGRS